MKDSHVHYLQQMHLSALLAVLILDAVFPINWAALLIPLLQHCAWRFFLLASSA
ncbi:MAG: hypothetical protein ACFC1C_01750 [Candidatus Malihini olakiniferum]